MADVAVNSFEGISDIEAVVWVDPDLDTGDGLIEEIAPSVFTLDPHEGIARTHFGLFLGSMAMNGQPGLRPVLAAEKDLVIEAAEENASESAFPETSFRDSPDDLWRFFLANSAHNMIGQAMQTVGKRPDGGFKQFETHSSLTAEIIRPEPIVVTENEALDSRREESLLNPVIARIDVLSLLGIHMSDDERHILGVNLLYADNTSGLEDLSKLLGRLRALQEKIEPHLVL